MKAIKLWRGVTFALSHVVTEILGVVLQVFCCLHNDDDTFRELIKGEVKFSIWENTLSWYCYLHWCRSEGVVWLPYNLCHHASQPFNKPNIIILLNTSQVFRWFFGALSIHELTGEVNWTELYGRKVNIIGFVSVVKKLMRLYFFEWVSGRWVKILPRVPRNSRLKIMKKLLCTLEYFKGWDEVNLKILPRFETILRPNLEQLALNIQHERICKNQQK